MFSFSFSFEVFLCSQEVTLSPEFIIESDMSF